MIPSEPSSSARVWITDGSPIPFSDVRTLDVDHRGLLGLHFPYKGLIDPCVSRGAATIAAAGPDDVLVAEAEWAVLFPGGAAPHVAEPERLAADTPVILQGLIEGKWLNRLLGTTAWAPATLGNNLLAAGPGIPTTLGAIEAGASGEVRVEYAYRNGDVQRIRSQSATLADLRGQNVLELVRAVLRHCRQTGSTVDAIDLGAVGARAAVVTEPGRVAATMRMRLLPIPNPLNLLPARRFALMEQTVRGILEDGLGALPDAPITVAVYDGQGTRVGEGTLTWRPVGG